MKLAELSPANFAIVMATGIIGIAAGHQGQGTLALAMFAVNAAAWPVLVALYVLRAARHRDALVADLRDHQKAPGFFTAVAGTSVLASQMVVLGFERAGWVFAGIAAALWLVLTYGILATLTIQPEKPALAEGITGSWLLTTVATQSIAVVAALLASHVEQPARLALNFGAVSLWLCGGMLYVWVIALIFYRYAFFRLLPRDLAPTYWINMGAMAISALAGAQLVLNAGDAPMLHEMLPFVEGGTALFWAVGTWWIPFLLVLGVWRYVLRRYPLRYDPAYWGAVFPLGMYSAATHQVSHALRLTFLAPPARAFFLVAAGAWLLAAFGVARRLMGTRRGTPAAHR